MEERATERGKRVVDALLMAGRRFGLDGERASEPAASSPAPTPVSFVQSKRSRIGTTAAVAGPVLGLLGMFDVLFPLLHW